MSQIKTKFIANNAVSNAKLAQMGANTIKGNNTGSTANASDLSASQAIALISPLTTKGDVLGYSTVNDRVPVGTNGQVLTADSTQSLGVKWATPAPSGGGEVVYVSDQQAAGTAGGSFGSGSWSTRGLNTLTNPGSYSWISLSSNQITLSAGTYTIEATAPAFQVTQHKARFRNVSDSTTAVVGTSEYTDNGNAVTTASKIVGQFTIASSKTFEVQHRCSTTANTQGYGVASNYDEVEIYTQCKITKIA